jgi:hypothetical protein
MIGARAFVITVVGCAVLASAPASSAQPAADAVYRVLSTKESKFQENLDRAAADGYRLVSGDAAFEVAILERATDGKRRSYLFAGEIEGFLKQKKLPSGFQLVRSMFAGDGTFYSAVFEKLEEDEQARDYGFVKAGSAGALRKRFEKGGDQVSGVIAIAWGGSDVAAIFERREAAAPTRIIASGNTGTLREEIQAAGKEGLCFVDGAGVKEAFYALAQCADRAPVEYHVIATTKTETFEKELNALAAKGMRLIPAGLVGIEKRVLMTSAYNYETVAVVGKVTETTPLAYRVIGTVRLSTFEHELQAVAAEGFRLVAFTIGPKEQVAVLAK